MNIPDQIKEKAAIAIKALYNMDATQTPLLVNATKPEFEGDYTLVLFALTKQLKKAPEQLGSELGEYLTTHFPNIFSAYNVIKGFLNFTITGSYLIDFLEQHFKQGLSIPQTGKKLMVEFASPNTNKPLHLGHLRNIFLGMSISNIAEANNNNVVKACVVNDRGIHICKSMIAWQKFSDGDTPQTTDTKGDHFVGEYYVKFNEVYKQQISELKNIGLPEKEAEKEAPIMKEAQRMLQDWEAGKPEVKDLWHKMNSWVYKGFDDTYNAIGSQFDKVYYESDIYLLGKDLIDDGLQKGVFYKKEDGSVWIDLTEDGLDEKLVQRKDGTSVYITQDIALAFLKQQEYALDKNIYVVGDEQNYHFKVLKLICQKMQMPAADGIYHLSYGMVELPSGKMKSREGTVVDADDIIAEMKNIAKKKTQELGKVKDFKEEELQALYDTLGIGALKFFLLRVDPKKKIIFNPEDSIDFQGFTGPFVQYTHARIKSILRKLDAADIELATSAAYVLNKYEKDLLLYIEQFTATLADSFENLDPSKTAIYVFSLAKIFNAFYAECPIAKADNDDQKILRVKLAMITAKVIKEAMKLLGIGVPERM